VNQETAQDIRQRGRTPNSSTSPSMLVRNSSSSVGTGIMGDRDSDSGSADPESVSTRVKEDSDDPEEPRDCPTTSKLESERSSMGPPKEDSTPEDSVGFVTISLSVNFAGLFEEATAVPIA